MGDGRFLRAFGYLSVFFTLRRFDWLIQIVNVSEGVDEFRRGNTDWMEIISYQDACPVSSCCQDQTNILPSTFRQHSLRLYNSAVLIAKSYMYLLFQNDLMLSGGSLKFFLPNG